MEIDESLLKKLYWSQKWSIAKIAERFNVHPFVILGKMKAYKIRTRSLSEAMTKFNISKRDLRMLYEVKKLSTIKIAKKFKISHATVLNKMKVFGVKRRSQLGTRTPVIISELLLRKLYEKKKLSESRIAKKLGYSRFAVQTKMKFYRIMPRSLSESNTKYPKKNFNSNPVEKAYIIGFRLGDLYVYRKDFIVCVRCSTTVPEQIQLVKNLFSKYSRVCVRKSRTLEGRQVFDTNCYLNSTFEFLVPKEDKIESWILKNKKLFFSFLAGYIDAEGYIFIRLPKKSKTPFAGLQVQSYDKNILKQSWSKLKELDIKCPFPSISTPKGYETKPGMRNKKDMWRLSVSRKDAVLKLFTSIKPFVKHAKKKRALLKALFNVRSRLK